MTDLINRVNNLEPNVIDALLKKYKEIIPFADNKHKEEIPYLLYIINLSVNYINTKHNKETPNWKTWAIIVIKRLFQDEKIKTREEIYKEIDKFYEHKKSEYKKYIKNVALYSDEYYRDLNFIEKYLKIL